MTIHTQISSAHALEKTQQGIPLDTATPIELFMVGAVFCLAFSVELGLRWACEGFFGFFRSEDLAWNLFDLVCVGCGLMDVVVSSTLIASGDTGDSPLSVFSVMRVLRVVRVVRIVRIIRIMKFFRELRMMIFSCLACMKSVLWVMLTFSMLFLIFAITFTEAVMGELDTLELRGNDEYKDVLLFFGSLDRSFLSLYMSMSGGNDWGQYYEALASLPGKPYYAGIFLLYITFAVFAVTNIVTGIFVDNALQSGLADREVVVQEELDNKKAMLDSLQTLFEIIDEGNTGFITRENFKTSLKDDNVKAYFKSLRLDVAEAEGLFNLLDYGRMNEISINDFITGCYQLQGDASTLEMKLMQAEVRSVRESVGYLIRTMTNATHAKNP